MKIRKTETKKHGRVVDYPRFSVYEDMLDMDESYVRRLRSGLVLVISEMEGVWS